MKKKILMVTLALTTFINAEYIMKQSTGVQEEDFSVQSTPIPPDEHWNYTTALLKGDGNSYSLTNEAGNSVSSTGIVASTEDSLFGNSSLKFDGGGIKKYAWSNKYEISTFNQEDFTIEAFIKRTGFSQPYPRMISAGSGDWQGSDNWGLMPGHSGWAPNKFIFAHHSWNVHGPMLTSQVNIVNGQWYHVALTREGSIFRLFVDGQLQASQSWTGYMDNSPTNIIAIGGLYGGYQHGIMDGYLDEVRITKGLARYTSNFSVPTQEFGTGE